MQTVSVDEATEGISHARKYSAATMPEAPPPSTFRQARILLWLIVALAIAGSAALVLMQRSAGEGKEHALHSQPGFGGPFILVGSDGKPFGSERLQGKPYAIYFGFTRCGDVCPTTLSRLVKLRKQAGGDDSFAIVFVTIDPANDRPKDVGQYADLFGSPIIGLTGTPAQIQRVKKQYGIYAEPVPNAPMGQQMQHTATVLLFDGAGGFEAMISPDESDADALEKLKMLVGIGTPSSDEP